MAHAAFSQSITVTTAYDTLGEDGLAYSLNEGLVSAIYTSAELLPVMSKIVPKVKTLKHIIFSGDINDDSLEKIRIACSKERSEVSIYSMEEIFQKRTSSLIQPIKPMPEDLAVIMFVKINSGIRQVLQVLQRVSN